MAIRTNIKVFSLFTITMSNTCLAYVETTVYAAKKQKITIKFKNVGAI